jgi:DNA-binding transcriptional MerR regulator
VLYKTGDFLRRAKISRQTLYTYLTMGLIEEADRTQTGRHLFDDRALKRVEIIRELNTRGYPLREIKEIYFRRGH